jgi:D-serine deaminase-like pyridoxal phosphate-dependent protein
MKFRMLTTIVGRPVRELDTPALTIELDAFERNLAFMSKEIAAAGINWRPHAKGHKSPAIARKEIDAGAIGVTCAKLGEAEVMAANGINDILVANQVIGPIKARRLAALCTKADVIVAVDDYANAEEIAAVAEDFGTRPRVIVELNVGMERAGVLPGKEAVELSKRLADLKGIRYAGLMGYEGHAMDLLDPAARRNEIQRSVSSLAESAEACRAAGLPVEIVSASGTGTFLTAIANSGITEVQAGGGLFGDKAYRDLGVSVEPALLVLTQVTSRPTARRVIVDAGRKTVDPGYYDPVARGLDGVASVALSAEHGVFELDRDAPSPRPGERLELEIGYHDQTTHLHDYLFGVRTGIVETVWPVAARGRLQ